jgi:hypothetical protein
MENSNNYDAYTLLSIIEMIDVRIERLSKAYIDKNITFEMPIIAELRSLKRELQILYYNKGE